MKSSRKIFIYLLLFIALIGLDRWTKVIAKKELTDKNTLTYFHDTIRLVYIENTGAFLSLGAEWPRWISYIVFIGIPFFLLLMLGFYLVRKIDHTKNIILFSFLLIIAGGMGNIIDRIFYDMHVSDFLNFGIGSLRTGILNLADIYVTAGVIMLFFFYRQWNEKSDSDKTTEPPLSVE